MGKKRKLKKSGIIIVLVVIILILIAMLISGNIAREKEVYYAVFNDGNGDNFYVVEYEKNSNLVEPKSPEKDGYTFIGWEYESSEYKFNNKKIKKNMTFKAIWSIKDEVEEEIKNNYTVQIKYPDGTVKTQIITEGEKIVEPEEPKRDGYVFKGWMVNGEDYNFDEVIAGDITLEAKWEKEVVSKEENKDDVVKYIVKFNSNGGTIVKSQSVEKGNKAKKPSNPKKTGYIFKGWTLNGKAYNFNTKVNKDITLVATWEKKELATFTVTFDSSGGSSVASQKILEGNKVTKPKDPTRKGYIFKGWTLNGKTYNFNTTVSSNITLVAKWTANTYTISVSSVDSYSPDRTLKVYENGKAISVKAINYTNGTLLCSGSNMTVSATDLSGVVKLQVVLNDETKVTATIK